MPEMGGIELIEELRKGYKESNICICSAYHPTDHEEDLNRLSIMAYLEKPLDYDYLREFISQNI